MHNLTHPETEERHRLEAMAGPADGVPPRGPVPSTPAPAEPKTLREALQKAKEADGLSNRQLAAKLRYSPSVVSQYLNGDKYPGDRDQVERRIAEFLRNRELSRHVRLRLVKSDVTEAVHAAFRTIRSTNDAGVIYGPSGAGKSTAITLYSLDNPLCMVVTLHEWCKGAGGIERLVFDAIDHGAYKANTNRGEFIVDRLRGSDRLLIVDNAHKATRAGLDWILDLHEAAVIPVALVGNEKMLGPIRSDDQRSSRVGYQEEILPKDHRKVVQHLVAQIAPGMVGKVEELLEQVACDRGRYRSVAKEISLAVRLGERLPETPEELVKRAHALLLRPTALA